LDALAETLMLQGIDSRHRLPSTDVLQLWDANKTFLRTSEIRKTPVRSDRPSVPDACGFATGKTDIVTNALNTGVAEKYNWNET
jgi:hypothetical protein